MCVCVCVCHVTCVCVQCITTELTGNLLSRDQTKQSPNS